MSDADEIARMTDVEVEAALHVALARIAAALAVIGETGCFCDEPDDADCHTHRIEQALTATPAATPEREG